MANFLLIHGAFRGAWAWDRAIPLLESAGHRAKAIDLPLAGRRWHADPDPIGLDDYTTAIIDAATALGEPIVVGHSQGGFMAGAAVGRAPGAFGGIAYLDAPIPVVGLRALDIRAPAAESFPIPELTVGDIVQPVPAEAGEYMTEQDAEFINARLCPLPAGPSLVPVGAVPPDGFPTWVAFCDHASPFVPAQATRAAMDRDGTPYSRFEAHHDVTVTDPSAVSVWLDHIAGESSRRT